MDFNLLNALVINGCVPYDSESGMYRFYASTYQYTFDEQEIEVKWFSNRIVYKINDRVEDEPYLLFKLILRAAFCAAQYNIPQFVLRYDNRHYSVTPSLEGVTDEMVVVATIYPRVF